MVGKGMIERYRATTDGHRSIALLWVFVGITLFVYALWIWNFPMSLFLTGIASLIVCFSLAHELYQKFWGTIGLMIVMFILGLFVVLLICMGKLGWNMLIGPVCTLLGIFAVWWDRPREDQKYIVPSQLKKCIEENESHLRTIQPHTPFHAVLGRGFLDQSDQVAAWLGNVYDAGANDFIVTAIYVEMNRFDINNEEWRLDGFMFCMPPNELLQDVINNMGEYESDYDTPYILTGMEDLQAAYAKKYPEEKAGFPPEDGYGESDSEAEDLSADSAYYLITSRMQELIAEAHKKAARCGHKVGKVRVFANSHDTPWITMCSPPYNK